VISREGDVLFLQGAVTVETVPGLVGAIGDHLRQGAHTIDFSQVAEVDSAAVALALEWQRQAVQERSVLSLVNIPEAMKNLANLYGVSDLMEPQKG
jgi:phospholipid transport system transporter-binding protein